MRSVARISLTDWEAGGRWFDYRGHRIFVREAGDRTAPTLLLIHGFPTASWDWEAVWDALSERFHLLTLDLIGFGFSAKPPRYDYSIVDQADLIEAWLRAEGVDSYHALAHDYGDSVAQELLARQAEPGERPRLRSLALLNGGLFPETHRPVLIQRLLLSPLGSLVSRLATRTSVARSLSRIAGASTRPDATLIDAWWALMSHNGGRAIMHRLIRYIPERRAQRARWVGALQQTFVPIALINGAVDPISGAHMVQRYRELVPAPDVTVLDDIGHYPQVEAPEAVLAAYFDFLRRRVQHDMSSIE